MKDDVPTDLIPWDGFVLGRDVTIFYDCYGRKFVSIAQLNTPQCGDHHPSTPTNLSTEEKLAHLQQENERFRSFIELITDASGPYKYLDNTRIVLDAREALNATKKEF